MVALSAAIVPLEMVLETAAIELSEVEPSTTADLPMVALHLVPLLQAQGLLVETGVAHSVETALSGMDLLVATAVPSVVALLAVMAERVAVAAMVAVTLAAEDSSIVKQ